MSDTQKCPRCGSAVSSVSGARIFFKCGSYSTTPTNDYTSDLCDVLRELNAANGRIKQLESDVYLKSRQMNRMREIGDQMAAWLKCERNLGNDTFTAHLWDEAKKPLNDRS